MNNEHESRDIARLDDSTLAQIRSSISTTIVLDSSRFKEHTSIEANLPHGLEMVSVALKPGVYYLPHTIDRKVTIVGSGSVHDIHVHIPTMGTSINGGTLAISHVTLGQRHQEPIEVDCSTDTQPQVNIEGGTLIGRACNIECLKIVLLDSTLAWSSCSATSEHAVISIESRMSRVHISRCRFALSSVDFWVETSTFLLEDSLFAENQTTLVTTHSTSTVNRVRFYRTYLSFTATEMDWLFLSCCILRQSEGILARCDLENTKFNECFLTASISRFTGCTLVITEISAVCARFIASMWRGDTSTVELCNRSPDQCAAPEEFKNLDSGLTPWAERAAKLAGANYVRFDNASIESLFDIGSVVRSDLVRTSARQWHEVDALRINLDVLPKIAVEVLSTKTATPWLLISAAVSGGSLKMEGFRSVGDGIVNAMQRCLESVESELGKTLTAELDCVEMNAADERLFVCESVAQSEMADEVVSRIAQCLYAAHREELSFTPEDVGLAVHFSFGEWRDVEDF